MMGTEPESRVETSQIDAKRRIEKIFMFKYMKGNSEVKHADGRIGN